MSLLEDFCLKKTRSYVEPRREGTPKGSPIGLSKQKYLATLAFLYDPKPKGMKKIAQALKVSYGVLRKWSTEEQFRKQVWQNYAEFSEVFWDYFSSRFDKRNAELREYLKQSPAQIASEKAPELLTQTDLEPVADFSEYHGFLSETIAVRADNILENSADPLFLSYIASIIEILITRNGSVKDARWQEYRKRGLNSSARRILDLCISCLAEKTPKISRDDRAALLFGLKKLRESFEDERA